MTSFTMKLGDDFIHVPKLLSDGCNWVIYRDQLQLSVQVCGLDGHLDGTATRPTDPSTRNQPFKSLTEDEQKVITTYKSNLREWIQKEAIVLQQIASTIPDSLYLKFKGKDTVKEAWDSLKSDFEKRSQMLMIDLRRRLQDKRCENNGNIRTHFDTLRAMREDLEHSETTSVTRTSAQWLFGCFPAHTTHTSPL